MDWLAHLWLPIVLSAVGVFIASSILWMVVQIHKSDFKQLPDEAGVMADLRRRNLAAGLYIFPFCDPKKTSREESVRKYTEGPAGYMIVRPPGPPAMGACLVQWFAYSLLVSGLIACIAWLALGGRPVNGTTIFRVVGTIAILAWSGARVPDAIWWGKPWGAVLKDVIDGIIYGVITAALFTWLWPKAGGSLPAVLGAV